MMIENDNPTPRTSRSTETGGRGLVRDLEDGTMVHPSAIRAIRTRICGGTELIPFVAGENQ